MKSNKTTIAYIDGANLHKGVRSLGWKLDYARFLKRTGAQIVYLDDKKGLIEAQNEKTPGRNASMEGSFS